LLDAVDKSQRRLRLEADRLRPHRGPLKRLTLRIGGGAGQDRCKRGGVPAGLLGLSRFGLSRFSVGRFGLARHGTGLLFVGMRQRPRGAARNGLDGGPPFLIARERALAQGLEQGG
jgi:hypothetical protein